MDVWPVREPWFLHGRRSVLQRAVLISAALAMCAMTSAWIVTFGYMAFYYGPNPSLGHSEFSFAAFAALSTTLCMLLPLRVGFCQELPSIVRNSLVAWLTTAFVVWICLKLDDQMFHAMSWRNWSWWTIRSWISVCGVAYAYAVNLWLPRRVRFAWTSAFVSQLLPPLLPWIILPLEHYLSRPALWVTSPELERTRFLIALWGLPNMAILVPWGLPWWQAPPEEATPE